MGGMDREKKKEGGGRNKNCCQNETNVRFFSDGTHCDLLLVMFVSDGDLGGGGRGRHGASHVVSQVGLLRAKCSQLERLT